MDSWAVQVEQFDIEQQIRRSSLVDYVAGFGGMSQAGAEAWLDANCPQWRSGIEPAVNETEIEHDDINDN